MFKAAEDGCRDCVVRYLEYEEVAAHTNNVFSWEVSLCLCITASWFANPGVFTCMKAYANTGQDNVCFWSRLGMVAPRGPDMHYMTTS